MKLMLAATLLFALTACSHTQQIGIPATTTNTEYSSAYLLPNTTTFTLNSAEIDGTYLISASFPDSYAHADSTRTYPVIYVLDGQWRFPLVYSIAGAIVEDGDIPEALVVSISWKETNGDLLALRGRDLTPTAAKEIPHSGEAIKFQNFLRNQLFPHIEKNYKGSTHRTLTGGSFSGLFAVYTLLTQPELFDGYIAATPSLWWDENSINDFFEKFPHKPLTKKTRFYLSWGELESAEFIRRFGENLKNKNIQNLEVIYTPVENSGHSAVYAESYTKGLQFIFQKSDLLLPQATLEALAGRYKSNRDLDELHVTVKDGRLHIIFSHGTAFTLKAENSNEFYIQGNAMTFRFDPKNHKLDFNNHGTISEFTRI